MGIVCLVALFPVPLQTDHQLRIANCSRSRVSCHLRLMQITVGNANNNNSRQHWQQLRGQGGGKGKHKQTTGNNLHISVTNKNLFTWLIWPQRFIRCWLRFNFNSSSDSDSNSDSDSDSDCAGQVLQNFPHAMQ